MVSGIYHWRLKRTPFSMATLSSNQVFLLQALVFLSLSTPSVPANSTGGSSTVWAPDPPYCCPCPSHGCSEHTQDIPRGRGAVTKQRASIVVNNKLDSIQQPLLICWVLGECNFSTPERKSMDGERENNSGIIVLPLFSCLALAVVLKVAG